MRWIMKIRSILLWILKNIIGFYQVRFLLKINFKSIIFGVKKNRGEVFQKNKLSKKIAYSNYAVYILEYS